MEPLKRKIRNTKNVNQYTLDGKFIATYSSCAEVARVLKKRHESIWSCCNGKQKTAYGYKWKYV